MSGARYVIVGIGELLWDLFPSGRQLGGAPANFAYHAAALGDEGIVVSCVGDDRLGRDAAEMVGRLGLTTDFLQVDPAHPTGTVDVKVDERGQPDFTIVPTVAWDFLDWTASLSALAARADAVCFGSLAQRSPASRETIARFLREVRPEAIRIFDVNLRQSFYTAEILAESLRRADVAKLNDEELPCVASALGLSGSDEKDTAEALRLAFCLDWVCVTRGSRGCMMVDASQCLERPGIPCEVADTVGAGDAFAAALVHHLLRGTPPARTCEAANRMGAWVASAVGATPAADRDIVAEVTRHST